MDVVYTYMSMDNGKEFNKNFYDMAKLSFMGSRAHIEDAHIKFYGDKKAIEFFKPTGQIDEFIEVDYSKYDFDKRFWCFPKFITYSLQKGKFLHVDLDMYIKKDIVVGDTDIVCERIRKIDGTEGERKYADPSLPFPDKIMCSGIYGGSDIGIFRELFERAKRECSVSALRGKEVEYAHLYSLEEVWMTQLANERGLTVSETDADSYLHFWKRPKDQYKTKIRYLLMTCKKL